jgi:hypothetical protein
MIPPRPWMPTPAAATPPLSLMEVTSRLPVDAAALPPLSPVEAASRGQDVAAPSPLQLFRYSIHAVPRVCRRLRRLHRLHNFATTANDELTADLSCDFDFSSISSLTPPTLPPRGTPTTTSAPDTLMHRNLTPTPRMAARGRGCSSTSTTQETS